ncbi:MAG: hypothetical protein DWB42_14105 [Chloroflexi bacterium]|nr:hypothetical protein [Chloroflexota bacterium]MDL1883544.1 hypothetical protein [Anaerolineae bacterium CFX8]
MPRLFLSRNVDDKTVRFAARAKSAIVPTWADAPVIQAVCQRVGL